MNMKLSYRDKVIFIVVIVLIILAAGFFLLVQPKFKDIEDAKYRLETKQQEKASIEAKVQTLDQIIADLKAAAEEIGEKQQIFLEEQDPYLNETHIREALSAAPKPLNVRAMNTTYATAGDIFRYYVGKKNILAYDNKISADLYGELPQEIYDLYNDAPEKTFASTVIGITTVTATFEGGVEEAKTAIDKIADEEKTIILNTVSTEEVAEDNTANGENVEVPTVEVTITMYSIFPLNVEQVLQESGEIEPIEQPAA